MEQLKIFIFIRYLSSYRRMANIYCKMCIGNIHTYTPKTPYERHDTYLDLCYFRPQILAELCYSTYIYTFLHCPLRFISIFFIISQIIAKNKCLYRDNRFSFFFSKIRELKYAIPTRFRPDKIHSLFSHFQSISMKYNRFTFVIRRQVLLL